MYSHIKLQLVACVANKKKGKLPPRMAHSPKQGSKPYVDHRSLKNWQAGTIYGNFNELETNAETWIGVSSFLVKLTFCQENGTQ